MVDIVNESSWAEQVEAETIAPQRDEVIKKDRKIVTEYKTNDKGEKVKVVSEFKIEKRLVPKVVAERKKWKKFGQCRNEPQGPNPANTFLSDEIMMTFVRNQAGEQILDANQREEDPLAQLKATGIAKCRYCGAGDHFTAQCPYRQMFDDSKLEDANAEPAGAAASLRQKEAEDKMKSGVYVSPAMRGATPSRPMPDKRSDDFTVRVTNLPEDVVEEDLRELFNKAGKCTRIYLAKDKNQPKRSKGFAFITFQFREDAERAILTISGHRYDHLILKVEWARPNLA